MYQESFKNRSAKIKRKSQSVALNKYGVIQGRGIRFKNQDSDEIVQCQTDAL